ncbi:MAG: DUF3082 domain-containing protein [Oscillatoriophycideae cyanobacterium NC_groundwater_1537_Pr4_S-0.65um_50_18]|nr:DUF3082 domain-containing protein [Oscillatoriophycideae cyanobacterium NC_groundwater_1537_Pr4_S-0.65um_50_18]
MAPSPSPDSRSNNPSPSAEEIQPTAEQTTQVQGQVPPTPLRCFTGAIIAGGMASALYALTQSIIQAFAHKPLPTGNVTATNIAVAVRTLVMGMSALATAIFAIAAVGLVALGIQLLIKQIRQPSA